MPMPDLNQFWMLIYGGYGYDTGALCYGALATGITPGGNPPYSLATFLAMYPKFVGTPSTASTVLTTGNPVVQVPNSDGLAQDQLVTGPNIPAGTVITSVTLSVVEPLGNTSAGSPLITGVSSTAGLLRGQSIAGGSLPAGATIQSFTSNTITASLPATDTAATVEFSVTEVSLTLSNAPTASGNAALAIYTKPLVPLVVLQLYINLATSSLMSSRWRSSWSIGIGLYVAHFATLWLQSEGSPQTTAGQIVANALQAGLLVSESADGLSASFQPLASLDSWAAWTTTTYGVQLATMARVVGAGAVYIR